MTRILSILFLLLAVPAFAENLYVRPNGGAYGAEDGSSWTNAFDGFSDVSWGSGTGSVGAGDTLYVGAGTYTQELTIPDDGSSGSPIIIRAAQETHTGTVNFNAGISFISRSYIKLDGEYNGAAQFVVNGGVEGAYSNHPDLRYVIAHSAEAGFNFPGNVNGVNGVGGTFYKCITTNIQGFAAINFTARSHTARAFDQVRVESCTLWVNSLAGSVNGSGGIAGSGSGPDGIQGCWGMTVTNTVFTNQTGTITLQGADYEHQDYIQMMRGYIKVQGCKFYGSADSAIGFDTWNGSPIYHVIENCEFYLYRGSGIRYYGPSFNATSLIFRGNGFYNHTSEHQWAFSYIPDGGVNPSLSGSFQNNVFYNCLGDGAEGKAVQINGSTAATAANWNFDYNYLGGSSATVDGTGGYAQTHNITGTPQFVNAAGWDFRPAAGDTVLKDAGLDLSAGYTRDINGVLRPQGSGFDVGAHEYQVAQGAPATTTIRIQNLRVQSVVIQN